MTQPQPTHRYRRASARSRRPAGGFPLGLATGLGVVLAVALLAGCTSQSQNATEVSSATKVTVPLPAGRYPSAVSKMVCKGEAAHDLGLALGETASVTTPTWASHVYTCHYDYPSGSLTLSVKELSSWPETIAYYRSLANQLGVARTLPNLGQAAFQAQNGSVVVRKDWKVLLVDITGLPPQFGNPPTTSGDIAVTVSDVILGCWAGD